MSTIKKIKNLRPIDVDVNLKYVCPNCCLEHWVTLKQVQYSKFVIVCDCDVILKPKTVEKIRTVYHKKNVKSKIDETTIDPKLLNVCCRTLETYGFGKEESVILVKKAYLDTKSIEAAVLIKHSLSNFGEKNG